MSHQATQAQLTHRREIHAKAIEASKSDLCGDCDTRAQCEANGCVRLRMVKIGPAPRRGRPPLPLDQRTRKRNYSIRLNPEHIAELQRRGTKALEAWLDLTTVKPA